MSPSHASMMLLMSPHDGQASHGGACVGLGPQEFNHPVDRERGVVLTVRVGLTEPHSQLHGPPPVGIQFACGGSDAYEASGNWVYPANRMVVKFRSTSLPDGQMHAGLARYR
ncbi:hypothetical protein HNR23_002205 [Nocardiopsis mwathae]|uniref:Uncharacterized protein n=1 Tax=Nocardiopsis mwathae TaxID=1472723 RepID=A0A7X0D5E9_9ACTN|nr:hypothetical protein [Nocardiopsis mwathae]